MQLKESESLSGTELILLLLLKHYLNNLKKCCDFYNVHLSRQIHKDTQYPIEFYQSLPLNLDIHQPLELNHL